MHSSAEEAGFVYAFRTHYALTDRYTIGLTCIKTESSRTKSSDETKWIFEADYEAKLLLLLHYAND